LCIRLFPATFHGDSRKFDNAFDSPHLLGVVVVIVVIIIISTVVVFFESRAFYSNAVMDSVIFIQDILMSD